MVAASPGLGAFSSSALYTLPRWSNPPSLPHKSESSIQSTRMRQNYVTTSGQGQSVNSERCQKLIHL